MFFVMIVHYINVRIITIIIIANTKLFLLNATSLFASIRQVAAAISGVPPGSSEISGQSF